MSEHSNPDASDLKVPFGLLDGVVVEPRSVPNGKACGCVCPGCSRPLIAYNQGKVRKTHYFGHWPGEGCSGGLESALHLAAKQALVCEKRMARPALVVPVCAGASVALLTIEEQTTAVYTTVVAELPVYLEIPARAIPEIQADLFTSSHTQACVQYRQPDLQAINADAIDWIEIRVTHAVDPEKKRALQDAGLRVIEIDLSDFPHTVFNLADIQRAVVSSLTRKTWVAHPGLPAAKAASQMEADRELEAQRLAYAEGHMKTQSRPQPLPLTGVSIADRPARKWMGDGVPSDPPIVIASTQQSSEGTHTAIEAALRRRLGLGPHEPLPKQLHLDLAGNAGALVPARLWLSQLFIDWIHGRDRGRYLVSELVNSVAQKFGAQPRFGYRDIRRVLLKRVLPYWAACGYLVLIEGDTIELSGKAGAALGALPVPRVVTDASRR